MLKNNKVKILISSLLILLPMLFGICVWDMLPEQLATHWGTDGKANGYSGVTTAVFALPLTLLAFHWLCLFVTSFDPKNKEQTKKANNLIFWIMPCISIFANSIIYSTAFGKEFDVNFIKPVFLGLVFIIIGNYMPKIKQNYTLGIKIKWTLENEENWNATHRFCGKFWVLGGILIVLASFFNIETMIWILLAVIVFLVFIPVVYSYSYHRKQIENGTATVNPMPEFKHKKPIAIISMIIVTIILIFCVILTFTGEIDIDYNENSFKVDCDFWNELTVEYDSIDSIEYRESFDKGTRINGLGSLKLLAGIFENEEFGSYSLYSYTKDDSAVVIKSDGKILVISGKDKNETKQVYEKINSNLN